MLCVKGKVTMTLPTDLRDLMNDRLQSRVKQVGKTLGREPLVAVAV